VAEITKQRLLRKAAHQLGADDLAVALKVPQSLVFEWMNGRAAMPDGKFLALAHILDRLARSQRAERR
jgi:hypothetical protein